MSDKGDCAIAIIASEITREKVEKFETEYESLPAKKKRGAWLNAWFSLPESIQEGCGDEFYTRFNQGQMGFAYWCEYTAWMLHLYDLLMPEISLYKPAKRNG